MKKRILVLAIAAICSMSNSVKAEGYQVNMQSTRQIGMGHTGVAMKLGAESQHFNPAGLSFMDSKFEFSGGVSAIMPWLSYLGNGHRNGARRARNKFKIATPVYAYAGYKITDKLALGLSLTTPNGSTLDWGKNWGGAHIVQNVKLQHFNFQPTISYKFSDMFSLGFGLSMNWGSVELSKGLMPVIASGDQLAMLDKTLIGKVPASMTLSGNAGLKYSFNAGFLINFSERVSFGASYRHVTNLAVEEGDIDLSYANSAAESALASSTAPYKTAKFAAEMPMPANVTYGFSFQATDKLLLAFDMQHTLWESYDELVFNFSNNGSIFQAQKYPKYWRNSYAIRFGGEYAYSEKIDLRAGFYYDQTPITGVEAKSNYNPETPGMNKLSIALGISIRATEKLAIDISSLYVAGLPEEDAYYQPDSALKPFTGRYTNHTYAPSVGISYKF